MGSEDLFHKRKARSSAALQRQQRERSRMPRFLIVCEGTKTEPHYLRELRDTLRIRPQMVCIAPNDGSSPNRVVDHALWLYQEDAGGDAYDKECIACLTGTGTPRSMPQCSAPKIYLLAAHRLKPSPRRRALRCGYCCTLAIPIGRFMPQAKNQ